MLASLFRKKTILYKLRSGGAALILLIILIFLILKIVPGGHISYTKNYLSWLHSGKGFIYNFSPVERVNEQGGQEPRLIGDPVYFSVFTPRTFSKAKLTVKYKTHLSTSTPIIEAGVLADNVVWRYDLRPLQNKVLDTLHLDGGLLMNGNLSLWQTENSYQQISDFLADLRKGVLAGCPSGPNTCLAVYNYAPDFSFSFSGLKDSLPAAIDVPLRGAHTLLFYVSGEPLRLEANFMDLNLDKAADPLALILSKDGEIIKQVNLADANTNPTGGQEEAKSLFLEALNLNPGVYKLEIKVSDDVVIKNLKSSLDRFVFVGKLWPVSAGKPLNIYTDANHLQVKAYAPASVQNLVFGGENFALPEPYKQFDFQVAGAAPVKEIKLLKDDVILETSGVFSFNKNMVFNPTLPGVDRFFNANQGIKYVLADYKMPSVKDGLTEATAEFNLVGAYREKGKYSFMISIPGLKNDDDLDDYLEISEVKLEFSGRTLWQKIWGIAK